jgi:hypothetical protein
MGDVPRMFAEFEEPVVFRAQGADRCQIVRWQPPLTTVRVVAHSTRPGSSGTNANGCTLHTAPATGASAQNHHSSGPLVHRSRSKPGSIKAQAPLDRRGTNEELTTDGHRLRRPPSGRRRRVE